MDPPRTRFVVTPWRNSQELLQLRRDLYGSDTSRKQRAVNKVFAWRLRKPEGLPLLLDSTADIVDVILQDDKNELKHNVLRLLYATALSRFITGLADTQIDLIRDRPSWFPPGKSLQLPFPLLEIRHRIVHRHLPSLAELKRAAQDSLDWLWEWYWIQLDHAFGTIRTDDDSIEIEGPEAVREKLQTVLKTYVKERKTEIKTRRKDSRAGKHALSTYNLHYVPSSTSTPSSRTQNQLIRLLVDDKMILPTDKKLGSSMSGAFLIWNPLLLQPIVPISTLLTHMLNAMNTPSASRAMLATEMDPIREAMYEWSLHVLRSNEWASLRPATLVEDTLMTCFSEPTYWNLRVAEALLGDEDAPNREQWVAVLGAAKADGGEDADVDMDGDVHVVEGEVEAMEQGLPVRQVQVLKEKIRGPRKVVGMWKPRPIGWVPEGWEDDE